MQLEDSVQFLKGVGPRRGELLAKADLPTLEDLLFHLPFRYEDRRQITTLRVAHLGGDATIVGRITGVREHRRSGRRGAVLRALLSDESGWAELLWFHQTGYFKERLASGALWMVHGRVEAAPRGGLQMVHPEIEAIGAGAGGDENLRAIVAGLARILPVYQKPGEIPLSAMRRIVAQVVEGLATEARSVVPEQVRTRLSLMPVSEALRYVHAPPRDANVAALAESATPAHRTLIFEELFALQTGMTLRKAERASQPGIAMPRVEERIGRYFDALPFVPTRAQKRVVGEIAFDMARPQPMNRLVHGDVGSGKTVVAFAAALQAIDAGYQVAVMAPTELLAEQHFATMRPWAEAEGIDLRLLTGSMRNAAAREVREAVAAGHTQLVVGTHALIQQATGFARLGLAIVDEQHRFGVLQRAALHASGGEGQAGARADTLLLSATPIPRTLSLTLYGDIDVSFLDELPAGRRPVTTRVIRTAARARLHERMASAMKEGRQCYIVYPLVEESEAMDLADATSMAEQLAAGAFREFRVGLVHGRMKQAEKDAVMRRFKAGDIHVLVATTVIEVGIDVPNATIMVVEHAERFGLAQLHQLRGRVGRGLLDSFCCLVADVGQSAESFERLRVMERTSDGFEIAEADLRMRGPGEYIGTRQSGAPAFRAANLVRDGDLLTLARKEALGWLEQDAALAKPESQELRRAIGKRWSSALDLSEVG